MADEKYIRLLRADLSALVDACVKIGTQGYIGPDIKHEHIESAILAAAVEVPENETIRDAAKALLHIADHSCGVEGHISEASCNHSLREYARSIGSDLACVRLVTPEAPESWRPMETAPRDGTIIIGRRRRASKVTDDIEFIRWDGDGWLDPYTHTFTPTDWMPNPSSRTPEVPSEPQETGWMIEFRDPAPRWWDGVRFTSDPNKGVRFVRREDAERATLAVGDEWRDDAIVTEHVWAAPASVPAAPKPDANPPDCDCEFVHASSRTCRSLAPSRGAVPDTERVFPAPKGTPAAPTTKRVKTPTAAQADAIGVTAAGAGRRDPMRNYWPRVLRDAIRELHAYEQVSGRKVFPMTVTLESIALQLERMPTAAPLDLPAIAAEIVRELSRLDATDGPPKWLDPRKVGCVECCLKPELLAILQRATGAQS